MTTKEQHLDNLKKLCRVCGKRFQEQYNRYSCLEAKDDLQRAFGINVTAESSAKVYPSHFCKLCYAAQLQIKAAEKRDHRYEHGIVVMKWEEHSDKCKACEQIDKVRIGGRPPKRSRRGRPIGTTVNQLSDHISEIVSSPSYPTIPSLLLMEPDEMEETVTCNRCRKLLCQPVELACDHCACMSCVKAIIIESGALTCPQCSTQHATKLSSVRPPSQLLVQLFGRIKVRCILCRCQILATNAERHIQSGCEEYTRTTLESIMERPTNVPLTAAEKKFGDHIVRRMVGNTTQPVQVSTRGPPLSIMKVTTPKHGTSSRTMRRRVQEVARCREVVSGGSPEQLLQKEIHHLSKSERKALLTEAGITVHIPADQGLAMKANLALPWKKMRDIRRWLKSSGVTIAGEKAQRELSKELLGEVELVAEPAPMTFSLGSGGQELRGAPMVCVSDLTAKLLQLLQQNRESGRLVWHQGIPEDEIWVKLGGDKGGGYFKATIQILNVPCPNSPQNTCVFTCYDAMDTTTNLHVCLDRYVTSVDSLHGMEWQGYTVRLFMTGDYEFLTKMYGLSGASGRHCYMWCTIASRELKTPVAQRVPSPARTLDSLMSDHDAFEANRGDLKRAKFYNNVIHKPFFQIPLQQVSLPALHIALGVFYRLFELLELDCHNLDLCLAQGTETVNDSTPAFQTFMEAKREVKALSEEIAHKKDQLKTTEELGSYLAIILQTTITDSRLSTVFNMASDLRTKITNLEKKKEEREAEARKGLKKDEGPFVKALDDALQTFNVHRQAFYSGTFNGNHVHQALKEHNTEILCSTPLRMAEQNYPSLVPACRTLLQNHRTSLSLFSKCHAIYDKNMVSPADLDILEQSIADFLSHYRDRFPNASITVKMHMMEEHLVPFLKQWKGVGFGLMSEQGAESIHRDINELKRRYCGIPDPIKRLYCIMKEYHLRCCPQNIAAEPPLAKRQRAEE